MDQDVNNNTVSTMEAQLQQIVKDVNDATDATAKEMKKSTQEGFTEVRTKLESNYNVIFQRVLESIDTPVYVSINIELRARNVQIPSIDIDIRLEDLNNSLQ